MQQAGEANMVGRHLLRDLFRTSAASPARPTATAGERLFTDPAQQPGGFADHPAVLDAATHTAALFATADSADAAPVIRVPAALEAFQPGSGHGARQRWGWCVGSLEAVLPSQTVITSFGLASSVGTMTAGARLCGFQAKVMGANPKVAELTLQYCIQWQAQEPAGHDSFEGPARAPRAGGVHWIRAGSAAPDQRIYRMPTAKGVARPAHDAAHSLALLQTVVRDAAAGTGLQLVTRGALSFPDVCETPGAGRFWPSRTLSQCAHAACCFLVLCLSGTCSLPICTYCSHISQPLLETARLQAWRLPALGESCEMRSRNFRLSSGPASMLAHASGPRAHRLQRRTPSASPPKARAVQHIKSSAPVAGWHHVSTEGDRDQPKPGTNLRAE